MKKAALATSYKFNINRSVGMGTTIRFSLGVTKEAVGRAFKNARINPLTVAQTTIRELNIKLIESESKNASLKAKVVLLLKENAGYKKRIQSERKQMSEKKSVEEVLAKSQRGGTPWLEPMREWIKDASLLDGIAKNDDLLSKKSSLQKIFGSNLTLRNKKVEEIPVKQWATLCVARKNFSKNRESFIVARPSSKLPNDGLHESIQVSERDAQPNENVFGRMRNGVARFCHLLAPMPSFAPAFSTLYHSDTHQPRCAILREWRNGTTRNLKRCLLLKNTFNKLLQSLGNALNVHISKSLISYKGLIPLLHKLNASIFADSFKIRIKTLRASYAGRGRN